MRYVLPYSVWTGQRKIRALTVIAQNQNEAQPGDIWWDAPPPKGFIQVGQPTPAGTVILGIDSID
ncbi:MAG: hypothetical protein C5B60_02025 [Chloroflexi bacterium]|nr:MAG: hypothetical protein C5B60_02025 [Chloroflexota bacterium]